jgi:aminoglycoside 6-adenylyltransferase
MISWMTGAERGFGFNVGKNYKFLEQYVSGELWRRLLSTYRIASYPDMWTALEGCMELFREVAKKTACILGYPYPDYDEKSSGYVKRQKERNYAD